MKKITLLLCIWAIVTSCLKEDLGIKSTITIKNLSDFSVTASSSAFADVVIKPKSEVDVKIESSLGAWVTAKPENGWLADVIEEQEGKKYVYSIVAYEYLVEYKVTGTAKIVNLTIRNNTEGTSQFSEKALPWSIGYKTFGDTFVYCSAQNQGDNGSVTSQIFYKGRKQFEATSEGKYVIATASGSIKK